MEVDLQDTKSKSLEKGYIETLLQVLQDAAKDASDQRDAELVQNSDLREVLNLVEDFLRRKHRICYGGMAINAHLPSGQKFYDLRKTLPDYDFFTPTPEQDSKELEAMIRRAGFEPVVTRLGIHEGTYKIFVNFNSVADLTYMPLWMYRILQKRALVVDGVSYADSDFLRMNMYLELSRPRGEVERWDKVYKRLLLLNMAKPPQLDHCTKKRKTRVHRMGKYLHKTLLQYIIDEKCIYLGADLKRIYMHPTSQKAGFMMQSQSPILAFVENPDYHIPILRQLVSELEPSSTLKILRWKGDGDRVPEMYGLLKDGHLVILLIQEDYCHAYNEVYLPHDQVLRIASLDTAITLFYQLTYVRGMEGLVPQSIYCFANTLVDISKSTRDKGKTGAYPAFSVTCHGHQPTKASLLKAKAERVKVQKTRKVKKDKKN